MTERPTCGDCLHYVPNNDPEHPGKHDEGTCHANSPRRGGIHSAGSMKYSDAWAAVLRDDASCGSDFEPMDDPDVYRWIKNDGRWEYRLALSLVGEHGPASDHLPNPDTAQVLRDADAGVGLTPYDSVDQMSEEL